MANLDNLGIFDHELGPALNDLRNFGALRMKEKGAVWSEQQEAELNKLLGAVSHLFNAVASLVNENRN